MSKRFPFFLAVGAGLAFFNAWKRRVREENARQWAMRRTRQGPGTAFITGASSGIGETFAWALARLGYNLVLLARREERLRSLAETLERASGVNVDVVVADLSDPSDLERAANTLESIPDLAILVNNAGFGTGGRFAELDVQPEMKMIQVHIGAAVRLIRAALPGMVARGNGGIINVSSIASLLPMPGNATYGATKSYLNFFTGSLNAELEGTGVRVQALCPGFTYSEFHDVAKVDRSTIPAFLWLQAEQVVQESLAGLREGREMVVPGGFYKLLALVIRLPLITQLARQVQAVRLLRKPQAA